MNSEPFPWRAAMGFAFGVLRLPPAQFWSMTPRELACAIDAVRGGKPTPMRRATFEHLMKRFPDGRWQP